MALDEIMKEIEIKTNKKLESDNLSIQVQLNTNGEKISKVLFTKSLVNVEKVVVSGGNIQIDGSLQSFALIKVESGEIVEINKLTTFSHSKACSNLEDGAKVIVVPNVFGTDNQNVQEITLSFVEQIQLSFFVCEKQKVKYVEEMGKGNQKIGAISFQNITHYLMQNFEIGTEIDLPSSISKILECETNVNVKDLVCQKDVLNVSGDVNANLIYLTGDEVPKIKNQTYVTEFHQEILLSGLEEGEVASLFLNVTKNSFNSVGEMSGKGVLELKCSVEAAIIARKDCEIKCMFDAFCPRKELVMEHQSFQNENVTFRKNYYDKVDGNYVLQSENQIDRIVFCGRGNSRILNTQHKNGTIVVRGEVEAFVVYALDDEEGSLESVNILVPFESSCLCDEPVCDDKIFASVAIKDVEARCKRAKEIDVLTEVCVSLVGLNQKNEAVVSKVEVGEDRNQNLCSMGIYVIEKADECWDVAKKLLVSPDVLMNQNQDLSFPITKPTQIIVYRQKELNN